MSCALVQMALHEFHRNIFKKLVLIYPAMDSRGIPADEYTWEERNLIFENTWGLSRWIGEYMVAWYFKTEENVNDPLSSPVLCEEFASFPETVMITNEYDPLRIPARAAYEKMKNSGLKVKYHCVKGAVHALWGSPLNVLGFNDLVLEELKICSVCCSQIVIDLNLFQRKKSPKWDSNTRPAAYEADALPTELLRHSISIELVLFKI